MAVMGAEWTDLSMDGANVQDLADDRQALKATMSRALAARRHFLRWCLEPMHWFVFITVAWYR
jgi:hypothetical protein